MAKETLLAWQQVILTALRYVPKAKDGHDAWQKLNPEEQAAMMDYLGEHCDHDPVQAQAMLAESCERLKPYRYWIWPTLLLITMVVALLWWLLPRVYDRHWSIGMLFWIAFLLYRLILELSTARKNCMIRIWRERVQTTYGTQLALRDMEKIMAARLWDVANKANIGFCLLFLCAFLVLMICRLT